MQPEQCLDGVRVLECGADVGTRFCGLFLGQLGAEVVRVEAPSNMEPPTGGAALRRRAERAYLDQGKRLVACVLGDEKFLQELTAADIVLRGSGIARPAQQTGPRAEYRDWRVTNPELIFVALSPFGAAGELGRLNGGDLQAQALSGWVSIIGNPGEAPLSMPYGIAPMQQGISAAGAAIAALIQRDEERRSEFVDISEAHIIAASIRQYAVVYRWSRIPLIRSGRRAPGSSGRYPHTVWPCADGLVMIILRSAVEWRRFVTMLGNPAWANEPRYQDFYAMGREYPDEVDALITPWMLERRKAEIAQLASEHGVPLAPLATADEVLGDEQLNAREFFVDVEFEGTTFSLPGLAAKFRRAVVPAARVDP